MADEKNEKIDYTKYPEGMKALAAALSMPIPPEESAKREAALMGLITSLVRQ